MVCYTGNKQNAKVYYGGHRVKIYSVLNYIKSQRFNRIFALSASLFLLLLLITTIVPVYKKIEYTKGFHFFLTKEEAEAYKC